MIPYEKSKMQEKQQKWQICGQIQILTGYKKIIKYHDF